MEKIFTCIVCPLGCELKVKMCGKEVLSVTGNTCKRGEQYAKDECINPVRTVTSTVRCADGSLIPVKTEKPIPKDKVLDCMKLINKAQAPLHISAGDVIIENVYGSRVIATNDKGERK